MARPDIIGRQNLTYDYRSTNVGGGKNLTRRVHVPIFDNGPMFEPGETTGPELTIFPPYGNGPRVLRRTLRYLGKIGVHAQAVHFPFTQLPPTSHAIDAVCKEVPFVVVEYTRRHKPSEEIKIGAGSLGGGIVGIALEENPEGGIGDIALMQPAGLRKISAEFVQALETGDHATLKKARKALEEEFRENGLNITAFDDYLLLAGIVGRFSFDKATGRHEPNFNYLLTHEILKALLKHAQTHRVGLFLGEDDGISSPPDVTQKLIEIEPTIKNLTIEIFPGMRHTSLTTKHGLQLLDRAIDFLNLKNGVDDGRMNPT